MKAIDALLLQAQGQQEAQETMPEEQREIVQNMSVASSNFFVALNKIDLVKDKRLLLPMAQKLGASGMFRDVFMLSATRGAGIDKARETLLLALPEASFLFEHEGDTRTPAVVACETLRAALYDRLHDELPYDAIVESERCEQHEDGAWHIALTVLLKRESQRRILLLRERRLLQNIQGLAQKVLQRRLGAPVLLQVHLPRPRSRQR